MTRVRERDENHDATKQQRHEGKEEKNNEDAIEQECTKKKIIEKDQFRPYK